MWFISILPENFLEKSARLCRASEEWGKNQKKRHKATREELWVSGAASSNGSMVALLNKLDEDSAGGFGMDKSDAGVMSAIARSFVNHLYVMTSHSF